MPLNRIFFSLLKDTLRDFGMLFYYLVLPLLMLFALIMIFGKVHPVSISVGVYGGDIAPEVRDVLNVIDYEDKQSIMTDLKEGTIKAAYVDGEVYVIDRYQWLGEVLLPSSESDKVVLKEVLPSRYANDVVSFYIVGMLVMSLMNTATFSAMRGFAMLREGGMGSRFLLTGIPFSGLYLTYSAVPLVIGLISLCIYFAIAVWLYHITLSVGIMSLLSVFLILLDGYFMGMILTLLFGGRRAVLIGSGIYQVLMFFSGIYFPVSYIPSSLRIYTYISPIYYSAQVLRHYMLGTGISQVDKMGFVVSTAILLVIGIVSTFLLKRKVES